MKLVDDDDTLSDALTACRTGNVAFRRAKSSHNTQRTEITIVAVSIFHCSSSFISSLIANSFTQDLFTFFNGTGLHFLLLSQPLHFCLGLESVSLVQFLNQNRRRIRRRPRPRPARAPKTLPVCQYWFFQRFSRINCSGRQVQTPHPGVSAKVNACWLHFHNSCGKNVVGPSKCPPETRSCFSFISIVNGYTDTLGGTSSFLTKFSSSQAKCVLAHFDASPTLSCFSTHAASVSGFCHQDLFQKWS